MDLYSDKLISDNLEQKIPGVKPKKFSLTIIIVILLVTVTVPIIAFTLSQKNQQVAEIRSQAADMCCGQVTWFYHRCRYVDELGNTQYKDNGCTQNGAACSVTLGPKTYGGSCEKVTKPTSCTTCPQLSGCFATCGTLGLGAPWEGADGSCFSQPQQCGGGPTPTGGGSSCGPCSDYCAGPDQCASQGGTTVGCRNSGGSCSSGSQPCLICSGGGGPGPNPTAIPKKVCGESCSVTSDCAPAGNGGVVTCRNGICENASCSEGKTIPGRNCNCSDLNACGQPCGASIGLCQPGSACAYIYGNSCPSSLPGNNNQGSTTYCTGELNGYTKAFCVARDQGNRYLIGPGGKTSGFTQQELLDSCTPVAPTPTPVTGICQNIKIYKNGVVLTNLSGQPGDQLTIAVVGTNATKARLSVNSGTFIESTTTNSAGEFTFPYTVPVLPETTTFSMQAELFIGDIWR